MGLPLRNPIMVASSPWTASVENVRTMAEHGAGAVVLRSLFEEQIVVDPESLARQEEMFFWYPEAVEYVNSFAREEGLSDYLELIRASKEAVDIPVIASINCASDRVWPEFAARIQEAGADALELNIYVPSGAFQQSLSSPSHRAPVEERHLRILDEVHKVVDIPVAAKLGFYLSDLRNFVPQLCRSGASGVVLFNRYYRPDIDIDSLRVVSDAVLSAPEEITLSLRWVALLSQAAECDLVGATGIHDYRGVAKHLLAGARAVQLCTTLFKHGPSVIERMLDDLESWMERHNFASLDQFRGMLVRDHSMASAFERVQYMKKSREEYPGARVNGRE
jgi:dihydroorotate dehydrogenase (fumarate)